jgi:hypothetical protein
MVEVVDEGDEMVEVLGQTWTGLNAGPSETRHAVL